MQNNKYRGFATESNKWVYGNLIQCCSGTYILEEDTDITVRPEYHSGGIGCGIEDRGITDRYQAAQYGYEEALSDFEEVLPAYIEVYEDSIGRNVGFGDKKEVDIYEGDIIRDGHAGVFHIMYGEYSYSDLNIIGFYFSDGHPFGRNESNESPYEIIGNVYENPELLSHDKQSSPSQP